MKEGCRVRGLFHVVGGLARPQISERGTVCKIDLLQAIGELAHADELGWSVRAFGEIGISCGMGKGAERRR